MAGEVGFDRERKAGGASMPQRGGPAGTPAASQDAEAEIRALHAALSEAESLRNAGKVQAARSLLEQLVARAPDYFAAWTMLGTIHHGQGNIIAAAACFQRAAIVNPDDTGVLKNLSQCYSLLGANNLSESAIRIAQEKNPEDYSLLIGLGRIANRKFDHPAAVSYFSEACAIDNMKTEARFSLADAYFYMGNHDEALESYIKALAIEKSTGKSSHVLSGILYAISQIKFHSQKLDLLGEIDRCLSADGSMSAEDSVRLKFARAHALEASGDFFHAWDVLQSANKAIWQARGRAEYGAVRERNKQLLRAADAFPALRDWPIDRDAPRAILIAGPSRSGKSTLEKLLASSGAALARGFEAGMVERIAARASQECDLPTIRQISALPKAALKRFSELMGSEISRLANGMKIVTDTHPSNLGQSGHVVKAFRNSVFLFVVRDIEDNAIRCLQKMYDNGNWYSYDLEACREYLEYCRNISAAWVERLPGRSAIISYEELVSEPRRVLERISELASVDLTASNEAPYDDRFAARPYREFMVAPA